jgi:hypothetical protein
MQIHWRVMLSSKRWDQKKFETDFYLRPDARYFAQSKGRARMVVCPALGDLCSFVYKGKVVMRGVCESDGFEIGTEHQTHPCNIGGIRPHSTPQEFVRIIISEVGLSENIRKTGQLTWAKMPTD